MIVYKKVFDKLTGTRVEDPVQTNPDLMETVVLSEAKRKALNKIGGKRSKSFSELTEEEQKLFTNIVEEETLNEYIERNRNLMNK